MATSAGIQRQHDVFSSVFPPQNHFVPTPQATPEIGILGSPGQPFGGFHHSSNIVEDTLQADRAWSALTKWLRSHLGNEENVADGGIETAWKILSRRPTNIYALQDWYSREVADHFKEVEPFFRELTSSWPDALSEDTARDTTWKALDILYEQAVRSTDFAHNTSIPSRSANEGFHDFIDSLSRIAQERWISMVNGLSYRTKLQHSLAGAIFAALQHSSKLNPSPQCWKHDTCQCKLSLNEMPFEQLVVIGMGGRLAEGALALGVYQFLNGPAMERQCFRVDWLNGKSCAERLQSWITSTVEPLIRSAVVLLNNASSNSDLPANQSLVDVAMRSLGRKRVDNLFDYIKVWPESAGAIYDIKAHLAYDRPSDKIYACEACQSQIKQRLLHAGASTSEVLGFYVNLINVFRRLDPRGVLLEKVSPNIRQYLRSRSDAVNVIAESLLAHEAETDQSEIGICRPIVYELERAITGSTQAIHISDWDDMTWIPDPIDALPNTKAGKADDVLSYILSLYEQEDFIKEIETVLAEHLLRSTDPEISKETRLLELLKTRLEATKLQNAEVMLKDIRDSVIFERRLQTDSIPAAVPTPKEIQAAIPSEGITITELYNRFERRIKRTQFQAVLRLVATRRSDLLFPKRGRLPSEPERPAPMVSDSNMQLRILSSSSWPEMQDHDFSMPTSFADSIKQAEEKFSSISGQRKLRWRPGLGRMSVTLELEDRTVEEHDIPAWRAMVVNAFADSDTQQTVDQLVARLSMGEDLVREALAYWLSKRVLYQPVTGEYAVLERLDMDTGEQETSAPVETYSSLKSQDAVLRENAAMFEAFIGGLLQNGGPKEIGGMMGITSMMKMVLPTFTYGDDEVKWLLNQMAAKNMVKNDGDTWSAAS